MMEWGDIGEPGKTSTSYTADTTTVTQVDVLKADIDRLKIELENTRRERDELKEENARLKNELENLRPYSHETVTALAKERDQLKQQNKQLLEALKAVMDSHVPTATVRGLTYCARIDGQLLDKIQRAIAKAEE